LLLLLLLQQIQFIKKPEQHHLIPRPIHLFVTSHNNIGSRIPSIKKKHIHELEKALHHKKNNNSIILSSTQGSIRQNRIMIVDDEKDIARLFAISLEQSGFIVDVFNDPLSALSNYKAGLYELLLLDIRMPGMNGFELYQKIKGIDDKAQVCFITAYEESLSDFRRLFPNLEDVDCFVRKPVEIYNLVKIVKSKIAHN
jgi:CheY-like chemotaxis protein